jgi:hypothetical protein
LLNGVQLWLVVCLKGWRKVCSLFVDNVFQVFCWLRKWI